MAKHFKKLSILSFRQLKQLIIGFEALIKAEPDQTIRDIILIAVKECKIEIEKRLKKIV